MLLLDVINEDDELVVLVEDAEDDVDDDDEVLVELIEELELELVGSATTVSENTLM